MSLAKAVQLVANQLDQRGEKDLADAVRDALGSYERKTLLIHYQDPEGSLLKLIRDLRVRSGPGHTFTVTTDEEADDGGSKFDIDGDGAFKILKIQDGYGNDLTKRGQ